MSHHVHHSPESTNRLSSLIKHLLNALRYHFWPVPLLVVFLCLALAQVCLLLDQNYEPIFRNFAGERSADGMRTLLSTAASGLITLAALVFSTTLVALTLASSQFGPRLLHDFIRAKPNQITLGLLLGTFLYCLVVLRSIDGGALSELSTLVGFILTLLSIGVFLFFVHQLVHSLQAENVVKAVARRLYNKIEQTFPEKMANDGEEEEAENERQTWSELDNEKQIISSCDGYLQFIDEEALLELATDFDLRGRVLVKPGHLLMRGAVIIAYERSDDLSDDQQKKLNGCFLFGEERTPEQDFEFEIRQLVEIGLRALSPGINDPFTAIHCIDLLAVALGRIARRGTKENCLYDDDGKLRLRLRPTSFQNLLDTAFLQIRHDGASRPDICLRIFEALQQILGQATADGQIEYLQEFAQRLQEESLRKCESSYDRSCLEKAYESFRGKAESS